MYLNEINLLVEEKYLIGATLLAADDHNYYLLNLRKILKEEPDYLNYFKENIFDLQNENQSWYWDKMISNALYNLNEQKSVIVVNEKQLLEHRWEAGAIVKISRKSVKNFKLARYITNYQLSDLLEIVVRKIDKNEDFYHILKDNSVVLRDLILDN
ncbi:hypothetical protein [Spiroplasma alleghenense]|uniref:Uncharacterized protein n=1 Tax=Spiroplasma alleghenense TaxID=216931 RepID=A0A345Z3P4_9MOLU|nr:hypothetical protein [Spiroplasma alleghenense]AXK51223.1 hypothetical protein SALLE_v1c05490 [Spiroplasma alleghenense]